MKINLRYIKEKDLFELQLVEPHLRSHFLLNRKLLNELRTLIERALIETGSKRKH
ncbi:hypothetical protein ACFL3N_02700 [Candidatus Omnitrophota bacterium]